MNKLLKIYFIALAAVIVLGLIALISMIPHKNRSQASLLAHPHVQEKLAGGFRIVENCGSYKRKWNYEFTSLCLVKGEADSFGDTRKLLHEVVVHETGKSISSDCEYRVVSPTDTLCLR